MKMDSLWTVNGTPCTVAGTPANHTPGESETYRLAFTYEQNDREGVARTHDDRFRDVRGLFTVAGTFETYPGNDGTIYFSEYGTRSSLVGLQPPAVAETTTGAWGLLASGGDASPVDTAADSAVPLFLDIDLLYLAAGDAFESRSEVRAALESSAI